MQHDPTQPASASDSPARTPSSEPAAELDSGARLGRYIVQSRLGSGGMGIVYLALDPELDRKLAIKIVRPDAGGSSGSGETGARLMREAQALAKLSHPNVVAIHDVGTLGDALFIAMEFIPGQTLRHWCAAPARGQEEILDAFVQAAKGLAAAHKIGIVHRDFKPDNVLVGDDTRVRVLDFGLARTQVHDISLEQTAAPASPPAMMAAGDLTQTGAIMGTPAYMASEQHLGRPTDARTDQFSFCVALYEALYGQRPFEGDHIVVLAGNVVHGKIRSSPAGSRVPANLRNVVLRGLQPEPDARFPSIDDLLRALENARDGRRRRRSSGTWIASGMSVVVAISVGVFMASRLIQPPESTKSTGPSEPAPTRPPADELLEAGQAVPPEARDLGRTGLTEFDAGRFQSAGQKLAEAASLVPENARIWFHAGNAYYEAWRAEPSSENRLRAARHLQRFLRLMAQAKREGRSGMYAERFLTTAAAALNALGIDGGEPPGPETPATTPGPGGDAHK